MLPLGDENPTRIKPYVNWAIILTCFVIFIWQTTAGRSHFMETLYTYGIVPEKILSGRNYYSFITNIFLHGGWSHLLGNMLFLWVFGDNIEDCCGHLRYLAFYIASGIAAAGIWILSAWGSSQPAVGASGAISGVLGAYFVLFPRAMIRTLMGVGLFIRVIRVPAWVLIGLWFFYQMMLAMIPLNTGIAYWAHIGGFVAGIALARVIRPRLRQPRAYLSLDNYL